MKKIWIVLLMGISVGLLGSFLLSSNQKFAGKEPENSKRITSVTESTNPIQPFGPPGSTAGQKPLASSAAQSQKRQVPVPERILDPKTPGDERYELLASLKKKGRQALPDLVTIAKARFVIPKSASNPHSVGATQVTLERGLRLTALEAIDELGSRAVNVEKSLELILQEQLDPQLQFLTSIALSGVKQKRPGKLGRFIDQSFAEFETAASQAKENL